MQKQICKNLEKIIKSIHDSRKRKILARKKCQDCPEQNSAYIWQRFNLVLIQLYVRDAVPTHVSRNFYTEIDGFHCKIIRIPPRGLN